MYGFDSDARRRAIVPVLALTLILLAGCATTSVQERDRIASEAMSFDTDGSITYLRQKVEAAREGALGGFGDATAGGCGCQ